MNLSEFKTHLQKATNISFMLPEGVLIPSHFHITEAGLVTKHFIDCGGITRIEKFVSFQLWVANDIDHRLDSNKLLAIISKYESTINAEDLELEFEYQDETINKYGLTFNNGYFVFTNKHTACLASDACGISEHQKSKVKMADLTAATSASCCAPNSGCCN